MKEKIMYSSLWMQVLLCLSVATIESHDDSHPLCFYLKTPIIKQINVTVGSLLDGNTTERCSKPTDSCYILWQEDPKNKSITIISQGCWNDANQKCQQSDCIPSRSTKAIDNTHFCCCEGNFCNTNITDTKNSPEGYVEDPTQYFMGHMSYTMHVVIIFIAVIVLGALVTTLYFLHRIYCTLPKRSNESLHLIEAPPPPSPHFDLDTLKVQEMVARGRYGSVYRGNLNEQSVAVKRFSCHNQQHFLNERGIYLLPHMSHSCLPKFIGSKDQIGDDGRPEFLLVVSFSPLGCLQDFLKENTVEWSNLCKMLLSISKGLAHLHSEIRKGDKFKPCIVHRDVTSRNILMKSDGTCMLCDFGFAIQISGSTYILNGEEVRAEEESLADVGTLRYMAPEILEGAVNLRDCESSLKQTDVYALGLVMWEIASRCSDLYQGVEVPEFQLPYEVKVGHDPSMEQMQIVVVKDKYRPQFPDIWKTTNPAIRSLRETIEDCWDQDAEARLTTLCVEERINELPVLWERDKAGLNVSGISPSLNNPLCNLKKSSSYHKYNSDFGSESMDDRLISARERANSLSECTTETLLSPSDAVLQANDKNRLLSNQGSPVAKVTYPIEPRHGRNPCLARNLLREEHSLDSSVLGNSLVDYPSKFSVSNKFISSFSDSDAAVITAPAPTGEFTHHSSNPIPYVQNPVNASGVSLKQTNLTSNRPVREFQQKSEKRWNPLGLFDKKLRSSLKGLLDRKTSVSSGYIPEEQQPLKSSGVSSPLSPSDSGDRHGQTNPGAFWPSPDPKEGDDRGFHSKDDNSLMNADGNTVIKSYDHHLLNGHAIAVHQTACHALVEDHSACRGAEASLKRPSTLPVQSFDENDKDLSDSDVAKEVAIDLTADPDSRPPAMRRKGSSGKRKGVRRVKTPFEIKGRFSLYDDRIMSSQELPADGDAGDPTKMDSAKFSVSVPLNMNTICLSPAGGDTVQTEDKKLVNGSAIPVSQTNRQNVFTLCDI